MPLQLLPMEESDLSIYQDVCWEAFKDDLMGLMYPNGYTPAAREWGLRTNLEQWRGHPDKIKMMKVIDTDLPQDGPFGKIVGVAVWKFYPKDRTEEELEAEKIEHDEMGLPPDANVPLLEEFFGNIAKCKKEIMGGNANVLLSMLATLPAHHRRGIGAMHLRFGLEEADKLGLPAYLEASPMGKPLYMRMGFEEVREFPFDAKKWGGERDLPHTSLRRPAQNANGGAR